MKDTIVKKTYTVFEIEGINDDKGHEINQYKDLGGYIICHSAELKEFPTLICLKQGDQITTERKKGTIPDEKLVGITIYRDGKLIVRTKLFMDSEIKTVGHAPEYGTTDETIENAFTYHLPKGGQSKKYQDIRDEAKALAYMIKRLAPDSRERSLAITKLEECVMWANAAIARNE